MTSCLDHSGSPNQKGRKGEEAGIGALRREVEVGASSGPGINAEKVFFNLRDRIIACSR